MNMSEAYLKIQTVSIMLNKNSLPKEIRKRIEKNSLHLTHVTGDVKKTAT